MLVTNQGCWNLYWNLPEIDVLKVSNSIVDANDGSLFEDPVTHLPTSEFWSRNPGSTHVVFPGDAPTSTELPSQYNALWVAGPADPYNAYFGCTDNNLRLYSSLSAEADWSLSLDTSEKKTLVPASGSQIAVFSNTGLKAFNAYGNLPGEPFQLTFGSELKTTLDEVQLGGDDPFEITQTIVQTFQEDSGGGASVRVVYLQSDVFPNYADIQVGVPPAAAPDQPLARIRGTVNGAPFEVAFGAGGFLSAASTAPQGFNFNQGGRRVALVSAEGPKPSPVGLSLDTTASKPGATNYGVAYWLRLPGADRFLAGPVFAVFDWGFTLFLTLTDPPDGDLANAVKGKNVEIWRWAKGLDQWPVLQATIDNDDLVDKAVFHWADNSQSPWQSLQTERDTTKEKKSS